jgi:hypothetical protein
MDRLEELVRDTLTEHAERAPRVAALLSRDRRHGRRAATRWAAAGLAAAAVVAVAVGVTVIRHHSTATAPATTSTGAATPEPIPAGQKAISYHGIEVLVPASLPIVNFECGPPDRSDVLLDGGLIVSCQSLGGNGKSPPGLTTVSLSPIVAASTPLSSAQPLVQTVATVDGHPALIGFGAVAVSPGDVTGVLRIPDQSVSIAVTTPSKAATEAILHTVRVIAVDRLGCRSHLTSITPTGNPPAADLVPGSPVSAVTCQYRVGDYDDTYNLWLLQSSMLSASTTAHVAALINGLPPHGAARVPPSGIHFLITFTYADGSTRTIDALVDTEGAARVVTDGNRSVVDVNGALGSQLQ